MTDTNTLMPTDAVFASLRRLYINLISGGVRDTASAKRIAEGLLAPAIDKLERLARGQASSEAQPVAAPAGMRPVAWTLTKELEKRETTTRAHLWFTDPVNCMWAPLYTAAQVQAMRYGSDATLKRLLAALERASLAECALRALIDECESDSIPGWEDRMSARINAGNAMLAAPSGPAREPLTEHAIFHDDPIMEVNAYAGLQMNVLVRVVRAVEQAHGITAANKGGQHAE